MAKKESKKGGKSSNNVKNNTEGSPNTSDAKNEANGAIAFPAENIPVVEENKISSASGIALEPGTETNASEAPGDIVTENEVESAIEQITEKAIVAVEEIVDHAATPPAEVAKPETIASIPAVEENKVSSPPPTTRAQTLDDLEEKALENWWNTKNKPTDINHFELAYSGVNLSKFGMLEAKVGKFRFRRTYIVANWDITIEENKEENK